VAGAVTTQNPSIAQAHRRRGDERDSPLDQELLEKNLRVRRELAAENASVPVPRHPNNGDEARYNVALTARGRAWPRPASAERAVRAAFGRH
jgi:hypothetical protein